MRNHLIKATIIFILLLAFSCTGSKQQIQNHTFRNSTWQRFDILSFDFQVSKADWEYTLFAIIRHKDDFIHERIPLHCIMTLASGEERIWEQTLHIRDQNGMFTGVMKDGAYELEIPVRTRLSFREAGTVNILIEQLIPKYDTPGIISFGLKLAGK